MHKFSKQSMNGDIKGLNRLHEFFSTKFRKGWSAAKDKHKGNHQVAGLTHFRDGKPIFGKILSAGLYTDFRAIDKR
ncbi:hypothetical protein GCM10011274_13660 [Paraglaciecola chathamensis]|uniref:Uncharacterized protein n=1 Tax=Paraglaciecola chathamensis TaxID=368405 RepID=A0A8H9M091_9ALTE|nr:hypothetical protein GCM10011274_13660 [Paraglaciecola oceanifecundans]